MKKKEVIVYIWFEINIVLLVFVKIYVQIFRYVDSFFLRDRRMGNGHRGEYALYNSGFFLKGEEKMGKRENKVKFLPCI